MKSPYRGCDFFGTAHTLGLKKLLPFTRDTLS